MLAELPGVWRVRIHKDPVKARWWLGKGVLQGLGYSLMPLVLSLMRLILFVLPPAYLFASSSDPETVWWSLVIAEAATSVFAAIFVVIAKVRKINRMQK